jgi:ribosomal protein S18 acetylase RimI-like enzyme
VSLRAATVADAAQIARLQARIWARSYVDLLPPEAGEPEAVEQRERRWPAWLAEPGRSGAVWEQDGRVVAFSLVGAARDADATSETGELISLYVDPVAQGAGLGRTLHDEAGRRLRQEGYREATLWVFAENGLARDMYERRGWRLEPAEVSARHANPTWWAPAVRYRRVL